ncbi:MAG: Histidine kinase [uncultured Sulfurovum sp.]|uniref:histidine kinase n=1 Tax=uncultured Sulfurovum sp. TaxID=269237 RepID=A0A6S6SIN6_9BACT|nr:MAG: Histidine kinase [uncultured Sulfurovum sp.]
MNRHSLIFHISLFFSVLLLVINGLFYYQKQLENNHEKEILLKRFHEAERILRERGRGMPPPHKREERLKALTKMEFEEDIEKVHASKLILQNRGLSVYQDKSYIYYLHHDKRRDHTMAFRYKKEASEQVNSWVFALIINVLLFLFYFYILKKLRPLQALKAKIVDFSNGKLEMTEPKNEKDEISEVSNEFNNAIGKIKTLQDSRNLFLRNIMHELNTPITKGMLITDLMQETKQKSRLKRVFSRFEYLLSEFSKIERITSNAIELDLKHYRAIDILNNAIELLLLENASELIDIQSYENLEIIADYEYLSIAMKNLLDNAIKYGEGQPKVIIENNKITIASTGEALQNISFEKLFNRQFESTGRGLGLGLYITHNIISKHGYILSYKHQLGVNLFSIDF